ncbi:PREDICTED: uncharacterized protein LOC104596404 isoform X2 [Nelumbo nucifera]|nr:PREDICTED: uncharacterized protein LOC104596404 isoform X2 [Nelumbo nucifera]
MPVVIPEGKALPCVIYCHGNSGCRADASEAAIILLPSYITVFTLDFSGSGLSEGEHVTLGWNEKDDLKAVVNYLRSNGNVSCIGLWGRSMGAVTSLMYGAEDPSIAGMVLDSPFSDLVDLMLELVETYKFRLPKFTVKLAIQYMRRVIQKKANFDIMDLNTIKVAKSCFVPVLIGHAIDDDFILPHHSDRIYDAYVGDKNIIKFEGDHNSPRPEFYFDSITIFFHNVLRPPMEAVNEGNYFEDLHDYYGESNWSAVHGIGYTNHNLADLSEELPSSREYAIRQLHSRRPMSRMEVPSDIPSEEKQLGLEKKESEHEDVSSPSSLIGFKLSDGHPHRSHAPSLIDDDEYAEYTLGNLADYPCSTEDEERMFMEAIVESLKDMEVKQPTEEQTPNMSTSSPECSQKDDLEASSTSNNCGLLRMDDSSISATDSRGTECGHSPPDASESSSRPTFETHLSSIETGSAGASACRDITSSVKGLSGSDRSAQDAADMEGGTRATLTVEKSQTNHVMDGLMQRWGLNFFRSS